MLSGYCVISLASPGDMSWQTATSLDRLLLQLWPGALFTCFLAARTPDESALYRRAPRSAQT
jgi:hypothetical protein